MQRDFAKLDTYLDEQALNGYLIDAPGTEADQRYLSGFGSVDPFITLYADGETHLLVRGLDRALAREESRAKTVASSADFNYASLAETHGPTEARHRVLVAFLREHNVSSVAVPPRFPLSRADALRSHDIRVVADGEGIVTEIRAIKTETEIEHIREAQRATEQAMQRAEACLASADIDGGKLRLDGEPLTSERIKEEIEIRLIRAGCGLEETIVAGGSDAANPHDRGSGPLPAGEPIVIDIFPRNKETKYHADMTRTFCVGDPDDRAMEWYELTKRAQEAAFEMIEPGVSGTAVHDAVCDVYEEADIPTNRSDDQAESGFIHGTGHGIGLDIHEEPSLSTEGGELSPGQVVTVEPGVYDPRVGGIRIEDIVVVTEDGYENLTDYDKRFIL